ncbi:SpvB/TcaC N-terminal domain-containing protein [Marinilabilia salmonicolor]|uniref:SpvB/TcaC N-terminal domain-containing protein n=1 Tax=Marinilabilia salmonicolor TaxID=989 RepID=UPI0015F09836|nr:SpvB/TcaC N-terminal domain-containing protein [Marinilabilia salmonicolor]
MSQKPQESFLLDSKETGNRNYVAKDHIILSDGFSFSATANESFSAKIDQFLLFPPLDKTYKTPDGEFSENLNEGSEGSVVGSIPATFNVTPSGAANYQIPIQCPPGINGMEPSLSLAYNSQSGVGLGSLNFTLSGISCIERVAHSYAYDGNSHPVSFDEEDRFSLNGRRLMGIDGKYGADKSTYGFEIEDYSRITSKGTNGDGPDYFILKTKDGKTLEFGKSPDSKFILSDNAGVYKWYLNKVTDRNDNYIKYSYDSEDGEIWITKIEYANSTSSACSVEFGYYSMTELGLSSNSLPRFVAGNEVNTSKVLKEIITKSASETYRIYNLKYKNSIATPLLWKVEVENRNGEKMPETVFDWRNGYPDSERIPNVDGELLVSGDFTGDGKDEIALFGDDHLKVLSLQDDSWVEIKRTEDISRYTADDIYNCGDLNNDGIDDLILEYFSMWEIDAGLYDFNYGIEFVNGETLNFFNEELLYQSLIQDPISGNFMGDGFNCSLFFTTEGAYLMKNLNVVGLSFNDNLSSLRGVYPGDFNGDGKTDILCKFSDNFKIYTIEDDNLVLKKTISKDVDSFNIGDFNNDQVSDLIIQQEGEPDKIFYFTNYNMLSESDNVPTFSLNPNFALTMSENSSDYIELDPGWGYNTSELLDYEGDEVLSNEMTSTKFGSKGSSGILQLRNWKKVYSAKLNYIYPWFESVVGEPVEDSQFAESANRNREAWEVDLSREIQALRDMGYVVDVSTINGYEVYPYYYYEIDVIFSGMNYFQRPPTGRKTWIRQTEWLKGLFPFQIKDIFFADFRGTGRNYLTLRGSDEDGYEKMDRIGSFYDVSDYFAVESINEGMDNTYQISYGPMISEDRQSNSLYWKEDNASYPIKDIAGSFRLVSSVDMPNGDTRSYRYRGGKLHQTGKGFLGFEKVFSKSSMSGIEVESQYSMVDDLNILVPSKSIKRLDSNQRLIETTTSLLSSTSAEDGINRYLLRPDEKTVEDHLNNTTKTIDFESYDEDGNLKKKTIDYGNGVSVTEETTVFEEKGLSFKYKPSDLIVTKRNGSESHVRTTTFQYDSDGNITSKVVDPDDENKLETNFKSYNDFGLPETIEHIANGETRTVEIEYSTSGRFVKKKTDVNKGSFVQNGYNEKTGLLDYQVDDRGRKTTYEYDGFGRLINTTYPNGVHTVNVLQWAGGVGPAGSQYFSYQETSGQSPVWSWYDNLGRKLRVDYFGLDKKISVSTTYNNGLLEFESQPYFTDEGSTEGTTYTYDDYGRLETKTNQNGMTSYKYPALKKEITSPRGTRKEVFNASGQVVSSTVDGKTVEYTYWPSGQMKTATPEDGEGVQYFYDLQGNPEKIIDPDAGAIEKAFNGFGELVEEVRDVHNTSNPEVVTTYNYDDGLLDYAIINGKKTDYEYDDYNRIEKIGIAGEHSSVFEYDDYDRIVKQTETIGGDKTYTSEKKYDKYGRIVKEIYPTGYNVSKNYTEYGVLKSLSDSKGNNLWQAVAENSFGQLTNVKKGGRELNYGFDSKGLPEFIKSNGIIDRSYGFTSDGNLEYCIDESVTTNSSLSQKEEFIYDDQNRLTDWMIYSNNELVDAGYIAYDPKSGNINGKSGINYEMNYGENGHGPHAITSIMGVPSSFGDERKIDYTDFSKVVEITEGNKKLNVTYGVHHQRVKMVIDNGGQTLTRYYQTNFEEEFKGSGSRKIHYISASDGLAAIFVQEGNEENLYYAYTDYLGSLVALADDDGNTVERFAYDPWGNRRNPDDWTERITTPVSGITARGYTMHEHLDAFDLINMNGRVYDPLTSRFLSADPFIQAPGQWMNYDRYAYAMNNPLFYNDLNGYTWGIFKPFVQAWNWVWDTGDQFAKWADKTDWFPSKAGAGINSAGDTWHYVGNSGNIYHNQLGNDYGGVVNAAISDARGREAYVSGNSSLAGVASSGGDSFISSNWFNEGIYWADALYRMKNNMPADAYSVAGNIDIVGIVGVDMSFPGKLWIINGNDRGKSQVMSDFGIAGGYDVGASVVGTSYYYVGDINNMKLEHFKGSRWSISLGLSYVIEIGGGFMIAPLQNGDYIIGKMGHIGVSPPGPSGNINWGQTIFY